MNKIVELVREQTKELNDLHLIKGKLLGLYEAQGQIKKAVKFYESVLEQRLKDAKQK
tara:strand:- start:181 stop:351 length:171 start_codon:yes stop_codon:yes gene_type:complete